MEDRQIIIAESGSTKTDWVIVPAGGSVVQLQTCGLNPYFTSLEEMKRIMQEETMTHLIPEMPFDVHFYGAGCGNADHCESYRGLFFEMGAAHAFVETDLLAVARAALGSQEGVAGILGTGANAGFFSNGKLVCSPPSLGFILGDEGSAAWIGKRLIAAYLRQELPDDLRVAMMALIKNRDREIIQKLYSEPRPNRYVASFASVLKDFSQHPWVKEMLRTGFRDFFKYYIRMLDQSPTGPVVLAGSVANHHAQLLQEIAEENGYSKFSVIPSVIEGLVRYHRTT